MRVQSNKEKPDEQIEFIRDLTRELILISKPCDRPFLTYLLEMVYNEALSEANTLLPEKSMIH